MTQNSDNKDVQQLELSWIVVESKNAAAILETDDNLWSLYILTIQASNSTTGYLPKINEDLYVNVPNNYIHNNQNLENSNVYQLMNR